MDAQQFLAEFGHIANAPGGVARLRELILSLAFKGELCLPSDDSSDALLDDIERQRLDFNGETRKQRLTRQSITSETVVGPYEIPKHWRWVSLSTVGHTWGQKKPDESFVYIDVSSIDNKAGLLGQSPEVISPSAAPSRARKIVKRGTLVYSTVRPYLLNIAIVDRDFDLEPIASTAFAIVHPWKGISVRYLYFYLRSPIFVRYVESVQIGMAYPAISDEKFYAGVVPLPPAEEQTRIVAKVDELMALCDKLEDEQQKRRKLQNTLRQATLQAVAKAQSPHELQTSWARLEANFGRLFSAPEDVAQLRDLILDLAVRGFLVEQSDADEPIAKWLTNVVARKEALVKQKRIPKQSAMTELTDGEFPFPPPKGWTFVRLGQITNKIGSGSTPSGGREVYVKEGVPFLRSQNIWNDGLRLDDVACITQEEHERMSGTAVLGNDVLLNITGASLGRCALVPTEFEEANVSQHVTIIRLTDPQVREYLHLCMLSPYTQSMIWGRQVGMAREGLSKKVLEQFEIPLPPVAEQHRIVTRVAELMRSCDVIEQQLKRTLVVAEKLAVACVANITGIAHEKEEEPVKVPQTELISRLRLGQAPSVKDQAPLASILARHNGELATQDLWQRSTLEIDAFYSQLKIEVAHGWIEDPSYELDESAPDGPKKYPHGSLVAKVLAKEDA